MRRYFNNCDPNLLAGAIRGFLFTALLLAVSSTPLPAQVDSAQVNGTVRDLTGAVIPNATVQIQNQDTGLLRSTATNGTGTYYLSQIPPGVYKVTASMAGFSASTRQGVQLRLSQSATLDFALSPGATNETVIVSGQSVQLDTSSTSIGTTLDSEAVNDLPLNGRNYTGLLLLQTGVTPVNNDQTGGRTNPIGTTYFPSIQGQNNRSNIYLLDGVNNNEAVSGAEIITVIPDDIQEMKVLSHTDSAQFGESLGGTINVITKAGTNHFHGGAWEYWQDSGFLDARSDPSGVLENMHSNQFGANIGGPVLLPHYSGRNRTFFYGSYEGYRESIAQEYDQLVPTAAEEAGDFSALLAQGTQLYNPFSPTRAPFVNNQIPANLLDQSMVKFAQTLYPAPNGSYLGGADNFQISSPYRHNSDQYDVRGDEYLTKRDLIWAHFLHQVNPIIQYGGVPGLTSTTGYTAHNFGAQWIHTFGPNSVLTVGIGQNVGGQPSNTVYNGDVNGIVAAAGFASNFTCNLKYGLRPSGCQLPDIGLGSYMSGGENGNGQNPNILSDIWEFRADYQRTLGRHTLYVGFNIDTNNLGHEAGADSTETFSPFQTSNGSAGGNEFASFLLSLPSAATQGNSEAWEHGGYVDGLYAQDQWKARDNLTINVGLRYDVSIIPIDTNSAGHYYDIFNFDNGTDVVQALPPACSSTRFAPCVPGGVLPDHVVLSSKPGQLFFSDLTNVQPRFGLSYALRPDTVLHAGYGRVYDNWAAVEQAAQNHNAWLMETYTEVQNLNEEAPVNAPTTAENPVAGFVGNIPPPTPFGVSGYNTAPQFRNAHNDGFTAGVQQKVAGGNVWTINYVGSIGRKLDYAPIANTALTPGPGAVAPRTPYPYMPQSFFDKPIGQLDYNSLQTTFQGKNHASRLSYLISYTWQKGLNYGTDGWFGIGTASIQNPYDFKADRSVSGYDLPQVFTAAWTWSVPVGKGSFSTGNRIADYALGNWQLNGIATLESGRPYTVDVSGDIANTGNYSGGERPNRVPGISPKPANRSFGEWINPAAFATEPEYTFGDTPRNSLRTDPFKNLDLSLARTFPLVRETQFQLRLDAFNSFNHPVLGVPQDCENCTNFGVVTSTINNPRQLQLSGKFVF